MAATPDETDNAGRSSRRPPGVLEAEVMAALRTAHRPLSPADVHATVGEERLAYTTVTTILHRLYRKGLAVRQRHGRGYAYAPTPQDATRTAHAMYTLLLQGPDRAAVFAHFLSELPPEDERLLQRVLHDAQGDTT